MNDTREIVTLDDSELDVVSGGVFNGIIAGAGSLNGNTVHIDSNNSQSLQSNNTASVGGGGNSIHLSQGSLLVGIQVV